MLGLTSIETQTSPPVRAVTRDNIGGRVHAVNRREAGDELMRPPEPRERPRMAGVLEEYGLHLVLELLPSSS